MSEKVQSLKNNEKEISNEATEQQCKKDLPVQDSFLQALKKNYALVLLSSYWLLAFCFVGLSGEFPINDDWIYAESVKHFLDTGEIRLLACAPACLFQLISAGALCKVFGFSHELLRGYGFVFGAIGSFALYACLRQLNLPKAPSLLFSLCLAANPLYLCLAFSFMTDTPAIALTLVYIALLFHGLKTNKASSYVFAALALVAATLVRQNLGFMGLANAAVFLVMLLARRPSWIFLAGLVLAPLANGYLADKWMLDTNDFNSLYIWYKSMVGKQIAVLLHKPSSILPLLVQILGELLTYLALFSAPILVCFLPAFLKSFGQSRRLNPICPVLSASVIVYSLTKFIADNRWMPFSQNLLRIPELGAHTILGINHAALSAKWRANLTWLSGALAFVLGAFLIDNAAKTARILFASIKRSFKSKKVSGRATCALAALATLALQLAFNTLQAVFSDIDRYYLFPLIGILLCLAVSWRWHRIRLSVFAFLPLILIAAYSLAGTQDMLAWNRARWDAIRKLEAEGINYKQIDGGAEYNYARDPYLFKNLILHDTWYEFTNRGEAPRNQWRWWTVAGEEYIVSFSPVPGYETKISQEYFSALSGKRQVLVLKRVAQ